MTWKRLNFFQIWFFFFRLLSLGSFTGREVQFLEATREEWMCRACKESIPSQDDPPHHRYDVKACVLRQLIRAE